MKIKGKNFYYIMAVLSEIIAILGSVSIFFEIFYLGSFGTTANQEYLFSFLLINTIGYLSLLVGSVKAFYAIKTEDETKYSKVHFTKNMGYISIVSLGICHLCITLLYIVYSGYFFISLSGLIIPILFTISASLYEKNVLKSQNQETTEKVSENETTKEDIKIENNEDLRSTKMPEINTKDDSLKTDDIKSKTKTKKDKYCKFCGGLIGSNTKKCTKCGKQYFKLKFNRYTSLVIILAVAIIALIASNIYQSYTINSMNAKISSINDTLKDTQELFNNKMSNIEDELDDAQHYFSNIESVVEKILYG